MRLVRVFWEPNRHSLLNKLKSDRFYLWYLVYNVDEKNESERIYQNMENFLDQEERIL